MLGHLRDRFWEREICVEQLNLFARWRDGEPELPAGRKFRRFPGWFVCGEGELVKAFLRPGQLPDSQEVR